jgi:hypothetical protein
MSIIIIKIVILEVLAVALDQIMEQQNKRISGRKYED